MINRQNWLDVRAYLLHIERERQCDPETVKRTRTHLRHLLEWADETLLTNARGIDPTYPIYMLTARSDGQDKSLAPASITRALSVARQFFAFARAEWPHNYKPITESWISSLQPPRHIRNPALLPVRKFWTLEDVRKIASVSTATLREERGKVAVCMLFLSGMRADALASMPISCVDLERNEIHQLPEAGVRTKNRKAAITYLLDIPDLFDVVRSWDSRLRAMPMQSLWYSTVSRDGMTLTSTTKPHHKRATVIARDVQMICELAGVSYLSPHKLRHGHVVHALKQARNMADLKGISQNVMHSSVVITDQVYGQFAGDDVRNIIANLGTKSEIGEMEKLLELLRKAKGQGLI